MHGLGSEARADPSCRDPKKFPRVLFGSIIYKSLLERSKSITKPN
jgi:hypothetical protein